MPEPPKISCTASGRPASAPLVAPRPKPRPMAIETMVTTRLVMPYLVSSLMPETAIEANIITAAPPRTLWGMMEITAASLGDSPASTRNTAPQVSAIRLTTLVIVTSPTF